MYRRQFRDPDKGKPSLADSTQGLHDDRVLPQTHGSPQKGSRHPYASVIAYVEGFPINKSFCSYDEFSPTQPDERPPSFEGRMQPIAR
jgi:hypothetical protein